MTDERLLPKREPLPPTPLYAVKSGGEWHVCRLVLSTEYNGRDHWCDKPPVWSEVQTTAYVCEWHNAEEVVRLPS